MGQLQRFGHGSPATTALGGFPTFTPRLSDDKVAPFFGRSRDRQNAPQPGFVPTAQWSGWEIKKLPSALAAAAARSHSVNSSPDRRARTCCSKAASADRLDFGHSRDMQGEEAQIDKPGSAESAVEAGIRAAGWRYAATENARAVHLGA